MSYPNLKKKELTNHFIIIFLKRIRKKVQIHQLINMNYRNCIVVVIFLSISFPGKYKALPILIFLLLLFCFLEFLIKTSIKIHCNFNNWDRQINRKFFKRYEWEPKRRRRQTISPNVWHKKEGIFQKEILSRQNLFEWYPKIKPVYFYRLWCFMWLWFFFLFFFLCVINNSETRINGVVFYSQCISQHH